MREHRWWMEIIMLIFGLFGYDVFGSYGAVPDLCPPNVVCKERIK